MNAAIPAEEPSQLSRAEGQVRSRALWAQALRQRSVWMRAVKLGFTVGLLQAAINQGDHWWKHEVDRLVILKSMVSPLIGFTLVLFSATQTWVQRTLEQSNS